MLESSQSSAALMSLRPFTNGRGIYGVANANADTCLIPDDEKEVLQSWSGALKDGGRQEVRSILKVFLQGCGYEGSNTPHDDGLRQYVADEVTSWKVTLPSTHATMIIDTASHYIEAAYAHVSPEHRRYVACYTAYFLYADDLGEHNLESLKQFSRRFISGAKQLNPVLDRLAELVRCAHELWTDTGADTIATGTLEAMSAFYTEFTTRTMIVKPGALRYPDYLRLRSGIDPPYIAFLFMRGWRDTAESYVQLIPDMEYWIGSVNDVLSFYKEELAQETNNYVHLRAAAEQAPHLSILRTLAEEIVDTTRRLDRLVEDDVELAALWRGYVQRFLEFHLKAPRYRLLELGVMQ